MPWPIYTERFVVCAVPSVTTSYRVPAGMRAVITCVTATAAPGNSGHVYAQVAGQACAVFNLAPGTAQALMLRIAAYHGETVAIYNDASGLTGMIGGYLFADPTGAQAPPLERELGMVIKPVDQG